MANISICIDVSDLDRATAFYCEALDCTLVKKQESHNTLSADGITIHIAFKQEGSPASTSPHCERTYRRHWTPVHLDFDVANVEQTAEKVVALGGVVEGNKQGDWGSAAFCVDPFGHGFCLLAIH